MAGQGIGDYNVDIVMCIDGTGSMSPILNEVKENALSFYSKFIEAMEDNGKSVDVLRIKVIVFRDFEKDGEDSLTQSEFFTLPDQNEDFNNYVAGVTAKGGGDIPENALEAIATALKSDWTTGGTKRRHAILVFSDAAALPLDARRSLSNYPEGMPTDLAQLGSWWAGTDQTLISTYQPNAGRLVAFVPNAEPWSELQAWNRYWPVFSNAGTGLNEVDIQSAIDILVGSF